MNSRERVLTTFKHQQPDRVPLWCGMSDEFRAKAKRELALDDEALLQRFGDDFRRVFPVYKFPARKFKHPGCVSCTPFGVERHGLGYGQPFEHPLANASLAEVNAYDWPNPDYVDASTVRSQAAPFQGSYAILGGDWSPFWHDAIDLLGMENLYMKMYDEPELVHSIMSHVTDFYFESSRRCFDAAADVIDIFFMGNDYGSQTGPLMGPDLFREFILPYQKRLIKLGKDYGLKTQLHCCGGIAPLIPILIEAGLDSLHAIQPSCAGMDLAKLKADFGKDIVLNGAIDSHHVLIDGTPDFVRTKTREVLDIMMPGGGYIGGASHDTILEETPVNNVLAMFDTIREQGVYSN